MNTMHEAYTDSLQGAWSRRFAKCP
jgi:hypothetical protein